MLESLLDQLSLSSCSSQNKHSFKQNSFSTPVLSIKAEESIKLSKLCSSKSIEGNFNQNQKNIRDSSIFNYAHDFLKNIIKGTLKPQDICTFQEKKILKNLTVSQFENCQKTQQYSQNYQQDQKQSPLSLTLCHKSSFEMKLQQQTDSDSQQQICSDYNFESQILLDSQIIEALFDSPCPNMVTLSLCLLSKYLSITSFSLTKNNVGKLYLICVIIAYKQSFDQPIQQINSYFSQLSGLNLKQINALELQFLSQIKFQNYITLELFSKVNDILYNY